MKLNYMRETVIKINKILHTYAFKDKFKSEVTLKLYILDKQVKLLEMKAKVHSLLTEDIQHNMTTTQSNAVLHSFWST
jgi:hypothetical protein